MRVFRITLLIIALCLSQELLAQTQKGPERKVVVVIIDGIAFDMLQKANTPTLDKIARQGSITEAYVGGGKGTYSETPTISAVGYNSLLTGTWVNKHNVFGNGIKEPNYYYPTIFRLQQTAHPASKNAIYSTWLDNRTKLLGDSLEQTDFLQVDYAFDGFELDEERFPHDNQRQFIKNIDRLVANEAARHIKEQAPDLSWIYLEFPDDMGHKHGDSPELYEAIAFEDSLMAKVYEAIQYREAIYKEEWLLLITTDHGRSPKDGKHHGGQSDRERSTWIVTNISHTNQYFKQEVAAVVDLAPTMADFLQIEVPQQIRYEWDGVSLIKPVDAINLKAEEAGEQIMLRWKNLSADEKATGKIYGTTTNNFKEGGKDNYELIETVVLANEQAAIPVVGEKWKKIVLETPHHTLNTWIITE